MFERDPQRVAFYHGKAWEATRDAYMELQHHVCERCGRAARIVHHKRHITAENVNDPTVTLDFGNLEALCQECHNREHFGSAAVMPGLRFDKGGNLIAVDN